MRVKVVARVDKPLIDVVGPKAPATPLPGVPPKLAALVKQAGEGLLAGEVWLFAAGARHDAARRALEAQLAETVDTLGWLPLRRADRSTWTLVGEFVGGRGWLVWDSLLGTLRCFAATGQWRTVGVDLPEVLAFVAGRVLFDLLLGLRVEPLDEERTRAAPVDYVVGGAPPGTEFARALDQPTFSALLEQLPWPDGVLVARQVLRARPSAEWAEHVAVVVKRSELCTRLVAGLDQPWAPTLAELRAVGFAGQGVVEDERLARSEPLGLRAVAPGVKQATHQVPVFFEKLFQLSPLEAVLLEVDGPGFARTWPLAMLARDVGAMRAQSNAAFVECLDAWILAERYLEAFVLAKLRVSSSGLDEAHLARLLAEGKTAGCRAGVLALLATQAGRPGVMALFRDLAQRADGDVNPIVDAATVCGKTELTLEALRLVYGRPRAWDEYSRDDAARVAARFGDERAQDLVRRRQARLARGADDL